MKLNDGQEEGRVKLLDFITNGTEPYFTLSGNPGTGKTFSLGEVISTVEDDLVIYGGTTSHAAKNVLSESFKKRNVKVKCYTVAQLLGIKPITNKDGTQTFVRDDKSYPAIREADVCIIDEASMISDKLFKYIMHEAIQHKVKIIAVGDRHQLPPVGQDHDSLFFDNVNHELTETMRFAGPIADIADIYRTEIHKLNENKNYSLFALNRKTKRVDNMIPNVGGYKFEHSLDNFLYNVAMDIKENLSDINYARVLCFKNVIVDDYNAVIREHIYGSDAKQFEDEEILISESSYGKTKITYINGYATVSVKPIIYNGQVLRVKSTKKCSGPYNVPCIVFVFHDFVSEFPIFAVDAVEGQEIYDRMEEMLKQEAKNDPRAWSNFHKFEKSFCKFNYSYALNCYKAQGSTYKNVYIDEGEIMGIKKLNDKQKLQALYVGMTRTQKKLIIFNKKYTK